MTPPQIIPLQPVDSQEFTVTLGNQNCKIKVYRKSIDVPAIRGIPTDPPLYERIQPIFLDLYVSDVLILGGALCLNGTKLVRDAYLGFVGDLAMIDTRGKDDPRVDQLGSRFVLTWWPDL
jgi:hypothetical protein